jgi:putative transposase
MKKSQFAQEQIIKILQEAEAGVDTIQNICRKHGVSEQSFYRWRQRYGGMSVPDAVRLRELERENARLKKLVAERDLEIEVMKEVAAKKW